MSVLSKFYRRDDPVQAKIIRIFIGWNIAFVIICSISVMTEFACLHVSGMGCSRFHPRLYSTVLGILFSGLYFAVCLGVFGYALWKRNGRALSFLLAATSLVLMLLIVFIAGHLKWGIKERVFTSLVNRAVPLITAVERYAADTGHPPETLADLVPRYLGMIPATNSPAYMKYDYRESPSKDVPWEITVPCSCDHPVNSDLHCEYLIYWPTHKYPYSIDRLVTVKFGDWVYVSYE